MPKPAISPRYRVIPWWLHAWFALAVFARMFAADSGGAVQQLVTCGRAEVAIVDLEQRDAQAVPRKIWSWKAEGRTDLPAEYQSLFRSTDDCKPFDGGRRILITSSGGGVALVDRERDRVMFYARVTNAHSADMLPGGRIAVAGSISRDGTGDALVLFDSAHSGRELWRGELPHGHGVVWDEERRILWALADEEIRGYRLANWGSDRPELVFEFSFRLAEKGGHDLAVVPRSPDLVVTTASKCWLFDRDKRAIRLHPVLGELGRVKAISYHPHTGRIAYIQALPDQWWSLLVRLAGPADAFPPPGGQVYKVRWMH